MKKMLSLLLVSLLLISALSGCTSVDKPEAGSSMEVPPQPSSEAQSSKSFSSDKLEVNKPIDEPPLSDRVKSLPIPGFLTEEQQSLYLHAREAMSFFVFETWSVESYPLLNGEAAPSGKRPSPVQINGIDYNLAAGRYREWDYFQSAMLTLFTPEYFSELIGGDNPRFLSINGQLGFSESSRGGNNMALPEIDSFNIVSQSDAEIQFELVGHYLQDAPNESDDEWLVRRDSMKYDYTKSFPVNMVFTPSGWRISKFAVSN